MHNKNCNNLSYLTKYEEPSAIPLPISLDSLANYSEQLITVGTRYSFLSDEYNQIKECNCCRFYDRTNTKHDQLDKGTLNLPRGFKTPLDFFESTIAQHLAQPFSTVPEINIVSFASGYLLRELIFIAKLIKELEKLDACTIPPIKLHAIDTMYARQADCRGKFYLTDKEHLKTPSHVCQKQLQDLIHKLSLNIAFQAYASVDVYNQQRNHNYPCIILAIDSSLRFDSTFPKLSDDDIANSFCSDKQYTQDGILEETKKLEHNGSYYATLTHLFTNKGMFVILEKKDNMQWTKQWVHTLACSSKTLEEVKPPKEIEAILAQREEQFYLSDLGQFEIAQTKRFKHAPLSLAVKERDYEQIDALLQPKDVNMVNAQSIDGFTALHWAAMRRNSSLIDKLIEHGANPDIQNQYGRTPVDYYKHQVSAEDFKGFVSGACYRVLCEKNTHPDRERMMEFNELYRYEDDIISAFGWTRNGKREHLDFYHSPLFPKSEASLAMAQYVVTEQSKDISRAKQNNNSEEHKSSQNKDVSEAKQTNNTNSIMDPKRDIKNSNRYFSSGPQKRKERRIDITRKTSPFFARKDIAIKKNKDDAYIETYLITEHLSLAFERDKYSKSLLCVLLDGRKTISMYYATNEFKLNIIGLLHSTEELISYLETQGETACNVAHFIVSHMPCSEKINTYHL